MAYPVSIQIEPRLQQKDRLTTAFRPILAIPHAILVVSGHNNVGLLSAVAYFLAIVSWFTILVTGRQLEGIREFSLYYLRWRTRALAYTGLFVDKYPPFGDAPYPTAIDVENPPAERDAVSVALRLILALPHFIVLAVLLLAWLLVTIAAWFVVLFTRDYPASLYPFASGVMRWMLRVEAYMLLLIDEYPPFALD